MLKDWRRDKPIVSMTSQMRQREISQDLPDIVPRPTRTYQTIASFLINNTARDVSVLAMCETNDG